MKRPKAIAPRVTKEEVTKLYFTLTQQGLVAEAEQVARLAELAAISRLESGVLEMGGYRFDISPSTQVARLVMIDHFGETLAWKFLDVEDVYKLSKEALKTYDMLEGIK